MPIDEPTDNVTLVESRDDIWERFKSAQVETSSMLPLREDVLQSWESPHVYFDLRERMGKYLGRADIQEMKDELRREAPKAIAAESIHAILQRPLNLTDTYLNLKPNEIRTVTNMTYATMLQPDAVDHFPDDLVMVNRGIHLVHDLVRDHLDKQVESGSVESDSRFDFLQRFDVMTQRALQVAYMAAGKSEDFALQDILKNGPEGVGVDKDDPNYDLLLFIQTATKFAQLADDLPGVGLVKQRAVHGDKSVDKEALLKAYRDTLLSTQLCVDQYVPDDPVSLEHLGTNLKVIDEISSKAEKTFHQVPISPELIREVRFLPLKTKQDYAFRFDFSQESVEDREANSIQPQDFALATYSIIQDSITVKLRKHQEKEPKINPELLYANVLSELVGGEYGVFEAPGASMTEVVDKQDSQLTNRIFTFLKIARGIEPTYWGDAGTKIMEGAKATLEKPATEQELYSLATALAARQILKDAGQLQYNEKDEPLSTFAVRPNDYRYPEYLTLFNKALSELDEGMSVFVENVAQAGEIPSNTVKYGEATTTLVINAINALRHSAELQTMPEYVQDRVSVLPRNLSSIVVNKDNNNITGDISYEWNVERRSGNGGMRDYAKVYGKKIPRPNIGSIRFLNLQDSKEEISELA